MVAIKSFTYIEICLQIKPLSILVTSLIATPLCICWSVATIPLTFNYSNHRQQIIHLRYQWFQYIYTIFPIMSMPMKTDPPPMKTEEQPSAKKVHISLYKYVYAFSYKFVLIYASFFFPHTQQRKDDDERVNRAAQLLVKSPILSVPQVSRYFV